MPMMRNEVNKMPQIAKDWYKPSEDGSFFGTFYYRGDHSFEGFLANQPMTLQRRTAREVNGLCRLLGINEVGKEPFILDAPCGYGRHALELARRGFRVRGLDACERFVKIARRRLGDAGLNDDIQQGEIIDLPCADGTFDLVINMFFSFGFYLEDEDNLQCLREFYRVLKSGGRLFYHTDVNVPLIANGAYNQPTRRRLEDGGRLEIVEDMNWDTKRLEGYWKITELEAGQEVGSNRRSYSMRVYEQDEFEEMCRSVGFSQIAVYGSLESQAQAYGDLSQEMIVVATKP